jgi:hypothetical protein
MLGFLAKIVHLITGSIDNVVRWVTSTIAAVYSYFDKLYTWLWHEEIVLSQTINRFAAEAYHYTLTVYNTVNAILNRLFADLWHLLKHDFAVAWSWITWLKREITYIFDYVRKQAESLVSSIEQWVVSNIYDPLLNEIRALEHRILAPIVYAYDLVTHPDKLVKIIASYLWREWVTLLKKYSKPIARFLLHAMIGMAKELADLLEIIITAMM